MSVTTEVGRMADRVEVDAEQQILFTTRKVRESGNSKVVSLPPQILETAGLELGDQVHVEADMEEGVIRLQRADLADDEAADGT